MSNINNDSSASGFHPDQRGLGADRAWIPGYAGYYCADKLGTIWSVGSRTKRWNSRALTPMTGHPNNHGYLCTALCIGGDRPRSYTIQTLMGLAWLGYDASGLGRSSAMVVDHINGVRSDNRLENLQILTRADNIRKRDSNGDAPRRGKKKPIEAVVLATGASEYYVSGVAASQALRGDRKCAPVICIALKGRIKTAYGRAWKYISWDEYETAAGVKVAD